MPFEGFGSTLLGLGFAISVLGFGVYYFGLRVWGLRFLVSLGGYIIALDLGFLALRFIWGCLLGLGVWGSRFRC